MSSVSVRPSTRLLPVALGLVALVVLVGCGNEQATHTPVPTSTSASAAVPPTPTASPTPGITRVPYPWPMQQVTTEFGTTIYRPANSAVKQEMQYDFLTYWAWSGHEKPPVVLQFVPDASQISRLATPEAIGALRTYVQQVQTSGQLVTYVGKQLIQNINHCTQDGLQCSNVYALGQTEKTVYSTRTGAVLSHTASHLVATVTIVQVYSRELQRWQVGSITINEFRV